MMDNACVTEEYLRLNTNCSVYSQFCELIADALLHDQGMMWLDSSYGDGSEKDWYRVISKQL